MMFVMVGDGEYDNYDEDDDYVCVCCEDDANDCGDGDGGG